MTSGTTSIRAALALLAVACSTRIPENAQRATPGTATEVRWDLGRGPSGVPWPNDALCWSEETHSGPCHPNFPTAQQQPRIAAWVSAINEATGWPTIGPIVVPFTRAPDAKLGPAIDLSWLLSLQQDADFTNDAVYVIDLESGLPQPLLFPTTRGSHILQTPLALDPSDPHRTEPSLLVETLDEQHSPQTQSAGTTKYSLDRDVDSDGQIDIPAVLAGHPCTTVPENAKDQEPLRVLRDSCLADALVDAYDSGEDTLRLYPRTPLAEGKEYAVVITDRLLDNRGLPIVGPFSSAVHPSQPTLLGRLEKWFTDPKRANYYGTSASAPRTIRFAWSFSTSSPVADLKRAFGRIQVPASSASSTASAPRLVLESQYDLDAPCSGGSPRTSLSLLLKRSMGLSTSQDLALEQSLGSVKRIVGGTLSYLPFEKTTGVVTGPVSVPIWMTLPRTLREQPLRVVIVTQERNTSPLEALRWAGQWASLGLATVSYARAQGAPFSEDLRRDLEPEFAGLCSTELLQRLLATRGESAQADATWTGDTSPDLITTSKLWRSDALELATLARLIDSAHLVSEADGASWTFSTAAVLGVGTGAGPSAMAAAVLPQHPTLILVDPATSPDRAWRRGATWSESRSALWQVYGPRLSGVSPARLDPESTRCTAHVETSVRLISADAPEAGTEIGCLPLRAEDGGRFPQGGTVIATNLSTQARRCVRLTADGEFSLGLPASAGDHLSLEIFDAPEVIQRFGRDHDCDVPETAAPPVVVFGTASEKEAGGVVVTAAGLGLERQSSELHRAIDLAAAAFAHTSPAPFVASLSQPTDPTDSKGVLVLVSPGDPSVPPDEGLGLAVAAKLVPNLPADTLADLPEMAADTTPVELASALRTRTATARIELARLDEGVPRLRRFPPDASACAPNFTSDATKDVLCRATCSDSSDCPLVAQCLNGRCEALAPSEAECAESLVDLDSLASEDSPFGAVRPVPYLRLARYAGMLRAENLKEMWQPQFRILGPLAQPLHPDWPLVALALPLANPWGSHGIVRDDLCHSFRFGNYVPYLIGHFIASSGTKYAPVINRDTQQCLQNPRDLANCDFVQPLD